MRQIHIQNKTVTITIEKVPFAIKLTLFILLIICFLIPITVTYFLFFSGLTLGILISYAFFWSIGFFILRFVLWNSYGKEVMDFKTNDIYYHSDFKYFKDGKISIKNKELEYSLSEEFDGKSSLIINNETEEIETSIKVPTSDLISLIEKLKNYP